MVNDNKNINTLVDDSDDDPTAELEILSEAMLRSSADEDFSADDTGTYQLQKLEIADETSSEKIRDLQADLSSRTESVSRLQRDIEQLRSKWSGLEKEISAREKQTNKITIQLADAQRKVAESKETLSQSDDRIKSLNAEADEFKNQAKVVAQEISQFKSDAKAGKNQLTKLKNRLAEKDGQIHALTKGLESRQEIQRRSKVVEKSRSKEIQGLQKQLKDSQCDLVDLCEHVDERNAELEQLKLDVDAKSAEVVENEARIKDLKKQTQVQAKEVKSAQRETGLLNRKVTAQKKDLQSIRSANRKLKRDALKDTIGQLAESRHKIERQEGALAAKQQEVSELQLQITRTESYADGLRSKIDEYQIIADSAVSDRERIETTFVKTQRDLHQRIQELDQQNEALARRLNSETTTLTEKLESKTKSLTEKLKSETKSLTEQLDNERKAHSEKLENETMALNEQLEGERKAHSDEIDKQKTALSKELDRQKSEDSKELDRQKKAHNKIIASQKEESAKAQESERQGITEKLDQALEQVSELEHTNVELKKDYEEEIRLARFELSAAQDTLSDRGTVNKQLASDLIENHTLAQDLEVKLNAAEEEREKESQDHREQIKRLKQENDDLQQKVADKDNSLAAMMEEMAKRNKTIQSIGEIENVIQEIDDQMSERFDEPESRNRVTRLLVGSVEGQELRFPLFKNRLTIGRTDNNDIQLNAQFISRRHAVIITDQDETKIVDWGSKNGIFVNEVRVAEQVLSSGDIVTIGTADFLYEERNKR